MESRNPASEKRSLFNGSLVKAVVMGGIVVAAGALLFGQREETKTHTIPPIIIRSVDSGDDPVLIETVEPLGDARGVSLRKKEYKTKFDLTRWVVVEMRSTSGDWVKYGFGRKSGLKVQLHLQARQPDGSWRDEPALAPHFVINGRSQRFPLTTEELTNDIKVPNDPRPHKRHYPGTEKRRISLVDVAGFQPLSTVGNEIVEVGFDDH